MNKHKNQLRLERCEDRTLLSHGAAAAGFGELSAAIRTSRAVYHVGQTVDMRLTLTNHTHHKVDLSFNSASSPLTIWQRGHVVWDAQMSGSSTTAAGTTQFVIDPHHSMAFTQQLTAAAAGAFGVHSGMDPKASARYFRVFGTPGAITPPNQSPTPVNPVGTGGGTTTTPGQFPTPVSYEPFRNPSTPSPVMPPIVNPNASMTSSITPGNHGGTSGGSTTTTPGQFPIPVIYESPTGSPITPQPVSSGSGTVTPGEFPIPVLYEALGSPVPESAGSVHARAIQPIIRPS